MNRRILFFVWVWLLAVHAIAQDKILTKAGSTIACSIQKASPQIIIFINNENDRMDSIETEKVTTFFYRDSLRMVVLPMDEKHKTFYLPKAEWQLELRNKNAAKLLQSITIVNEVSFVPGRSDLTSDAKKKIADMVKELKNSPDIHIEISAHTDSLGNDLANQNISDKRAKGLKEYLKVQGVKADNIVAIGKGESNPIFSDNRANRRIEIRVISIDKVQLYFSQKYIPPKIVEPPAKTQIIQDQPKESKPVEVADATTSLQQTNLISRPKKKREFAISSPIEAFYTIEKLSPTWSNKESGLGILQGFGAGLMLNYYLAPRVGLTFQSGFSRWQVQRKYVTEGVLQFTSDETLTRIPAYLGIKLYPIKNIYFHPQVGGILLKQETANSDTNPDGNNIPSVRMIKIGTAVAIGYEWYVKSFFIDFAGQYHFMPNKDFNNIADPLHFAGLRIAAGFKF